MRNRAITKKLVQLVHDEEGLTLAAYRYEIMAFGVTAFRYAIMPSKAEDARIKVELRARVSSAMMKRGYHENDS